MRMHRYLCYAVGTALLALLAATGCGSNSKRIIILINGDSPFWDACRVGVKEANERFQLGNAGLQATVENNDGTPQGQIDKLKQFAGQSDIVALGISACDAGNEAVAEELRKLKAKGIQIITIDSDIDRGRMRDTRTAFIGTDNLSGGRELGKCAHYLRPQGGAYVTFVGRLGAQNAMERIDGVRQGVDGKLKELDKMGDDIDRERARENVRNAIANHPDLNVLVGIWSYNAPAIVDVVRQNRRRKDFTVVAFDAEPEAVKFMTEGFIDAMVVQNPYEMGYQGVRLMKALVQNDQSAIKAILPDLGKPEGDIYDTGIKVVVPDTGSPLKAEMFDKKTQFLKLSEFQKWLNEYNLAGS
jgi:ribose transport system substrate-binding protein